MVNPFVRGPGTLVGCRYRPSVSTWSRHSPETFVYTFRPPDRRKFRLQPRFRLVTRGSPGVHPGVTRPLRPTPAPPPPRGVCGPSPGPRPTGGETGRVHLRRRSPHGTGGSHSSHEARTRTFVLLLCPLACHPVATVQLSPLRYTARRGAGTLSRGTTGTARQRGDHLSQRASWRAIGTRSLVFCVATSTTKSATLSAST